MMRRRPGMMLGGAALAGGLGSQVVSGMMDVGGEVQAAPMSEGTIPGALLDRFSGILDRFSAALNALTTKKSAPTAPSGGGTATTGQSSEPGASPGGVVPPGGPAEDPGGATGPAGAATRSLLDSIAFAEGTYDQPNKGY